MRIAIFDHNLEGVTESSWEDIEKHNKPPQIFRYGGSLRRLEQHPDGTPILRDMTAARLRYESAKATEWLTVRNEQEFRAKPPMDVMVNMLAEPNPPVPWLQRITQVPVYAGDGRLISRKGYDPESGVYYLPAKGLQVAKIPDQPEGYVEVAKNILDEPTTDFPFADESSRAHAYALRLLPFARELIPGPTPLHIVDSPVMCTGKGLLVEVCLHPALGSGLSFSSETGEEDELRRRITSALREPAGAFVIDNLTKPLESGTFAAALTATSWNDRILRTNDLIRLPVRMIWVVTGNNVQLSREIARRSIRIRLDSEMECPWARPLESFALPRLLEWVAKNRSLQIWASLVLVQNWLVSGRSKPNHLRSLGSFEAWSEVMGGILGAAGIVGFLLNRNELHRYADFKDARWEKFVGQWWKSFEARPTSVSGLLEAAIQAEIIHSEDHSGKVSLGKRLSRRQDQVIAGYKIVLAGTKSRAALWQLQVASKVEAWQQSPPK